eukprot:6731277-Pyramimonas_sp.AAC.1
MAQEKEQYSSLCQSYSMRELKHRSAELRTVSWTETHCATLITANRSHGGAAAGPAATDSGPASD